MTKYVKVDTIKNVLGKIITDTAETGKLIIRLAENDGRELTQSERKMVIERHAAIKALIFVHDELLSDEDFLKIIEVIDIPDIKEDIDTNKLKNRFTQIEIVMNGKDE